MLVCRAPKLQILQFSNRHLFSLSRFNTNALLSSKPILSFIASFGTKNGVQKKVAVDKQREIAKKAAERQKEQKNKLAEKESANKGAEKVKKQKEKEKEQKKREIQKEKAKKAAEREHLANQRRKEKEKQQKEKEREKKKALVSKETAKKEVQKQKQQKLKEEKEARPKRSKAAVAYFISDQFPKTNSKLTSAERFKEIIEKWKGLSEVEKRPFVEQSKKDRERYVKQKEDYQKNKPKRPLNAYLLFFQSVRPDLVKKNPGDSIVDTAKKIGIMWKSLPLQQKEKFEAQAKSSQKK